jgi:DNA-binding NarL/FixJ family response regulator
MNAAFAHKVLIVDDEPHVRAFLRLVLEELGTVEVREAADSPNALLMYQHFEPDLVLLDVNLPGENGLTVLEKLLALDADAQVVMLTAVASREMVEKCTAAGVLNYIRKDLPRDQLVKLLRETWASACAGQSV